MAAPTRFPLSFSLNGKEPQEGSASLSEDSLSVIPSFGEASIFSFRDMLSIGSAEYRIEISLRGGESLAISGLGYKHEDFLRALFQARNELALGDMLMGEGMKMGSVRADFSRVSEEGAATSGQCEARVYETALVLLPDSGDLLRLPFCELAGMKQEGFSLIIQGEFGEKVALSAMGRQLDPFRKALSDAANELTLKAQALLKDCAPDATPAQVAQAARLMRDGRAARRGELDAISPSIWAGLQKRVEAAGLGAEYGWLEGKSRKESMCIGIKRSLMGDLEGEYIWFLAPIYEAGRPANAIAMEAASASGSGKATYLFRMIGRGEARGMGGGELEKRLPASLGLISRCMIAVNFRREPIYLDERRLDEPKYSRYRFSIARLSRLRELRALFIGRVVHGDSWKKGIEALLDFNSSAQDDSRWQGGEDMDEDEAGGG